MFDCRRIDQLDAGGRLISAGLEWTEGRNWLLALYPLALLTLCGGAVVALLAAPFVNSPLVALIGAAAMGWLGWMLWITPPQGIPRQLLFCRDGSIHAPLGFSCYNSKHRMVAAYGQLIDRHDAAVSTVRTLETAIENARESAAAFRDKQGAVFQRLTEKFDAIIRELVGPRARGSTALTGKGLELRVNLGGDRSTAAIESLKIIAFDLAALTLSIEGRAVTPEFLLHDSRGRSRLVALLPAFPACPPA